MPICFVQLINSEKSTIIISVIKMKLTESYPKYADNFVIALKYHITVTQ